MNHLDGFLNELKVMGFDKAASAAAKAVQKTEKEHQQQLRNLEIGVVAWNMNKDLNFFHIVDHWIMCIYLCDIINNICSYGSVVGNKVMTLYIRSSNSSH